MEKEMEKDLIEELLGLDDENFNTEKTGEVEVDRLTEVLGHPFIVKVKSLSPQRIYELQGRVIDSKGNMNLGGFYNGNLNICSEAILTPDFNNPALKKKFKLSERALKQEVLTKIFNVQEITAIGQTVMDISGFTQLKDKPIAEDLKND